MKIKNLLLFACFAFVFTSCSRVYSPALYHQDMAYQPKPTSFDSVKSATYISAGISSGSNVNYSDNLTSGQFNISRGHRIDNFNLAYGVFGVIGDYGNGESGDSGAEKKPNYFTDKYFEAVGGRISGNFFTTYNNVEFRFIGFEAAYSHEFGAFANYRHNLQTQGGYFVDARTELVTTGLSSEVILHSPRGSQLEHGFNFFLGTTLGHNALEDTYYNNNDDNNTRLFRAIFPKFTYFIKYHHYMGIFEATNYNIMARFAYAF